MDEALAGINNIAKTSVTALNAHLTQEASLNWRVAYRASGVSSGSTAKHLS